MVIFKLKIYFYFILLVGCFRTQKKVYRFDRYDVCEIGPGKAFNVSYIILKPVGHGTAVDGQFEIYKDFDEMRVAAKITKCAGKELLDSCEYVATINLKNVCGFIAQKNSLMSTMIYSHHPPLTCPVKKGTMVLRNGTFDPNLISVIPLENAYWKMEALIFEAKTNEYIYKLCVEGQVIVYWE